MGSARLASVILVAGACLAACSGTDEERGPSVPRPVGTASSAASPTAAPVVGGDAILIEERVTNARRHIGMVLATSVLGDAPFCANGTTSGASIGPTITEIFQCRTGTLKVRFAPTQRGLVQGASWEVVSGTGTFEGLRGGGSMIAKFDDTNPDVGRVIFVGTVGR